MGGKGKKRKQRDKALKMGYGATMIPFKKEDKKWWKHVATPQKVQVIADQVFGGVYYCVGDRKTGRSVESPKD